MLALGSSPAAAQERGDAGALGAEHGAGTVGARATPGREDRGATSALDEGEQQAGERGGQGPATRPFARAAAFAAYEAVRQRELAEGDDGSQISLATGETFGSAGVLGELGVDHVGERSTARGAYLLGVQVRDDAPVSLQDVTQGVQAQVERRLDDRTAWTLRAGGFWGVRDSETTLTGVGLGGAPATRASRTEQRVLVRLPYLRADAGLGLIHASSERTTHRLGLAGEGMFYPDRGVVRSSGERLFETVTFGPEYALESAVGPRDTFLAAASARTTLFLPVLDAASEDAEAEATTADAGLAPLETLALEAGWRHQVSTRWRLHGRVGAGAVVPIEDNGLDVGTSFNLLGAVGTSWGVDRWRLQVDGERGLVQSEVGAVFATTTARVAATRRWTPTVDTRVGGAASRYDVATQVFQSEGDLRAFAAPPLGSDLDRPALEARARRAQEGYGLEGVFELTWRFWDFGGMSIAYVVERRLSDDPDRGDRLAHRGVVGCTLSSLETPVATGETLDAE